MKHFFIGIFGSIGVVVLFSCIQATKVQSFNDDGIELNKDSLTYQKGKTLRTVYVDYFPIGAAITPGEDLTNPEIANFLKTQFSSLTAKQAMQPFWIHPAENKYNWKEADALVEFAQMNKMLVRGHCLLYYRDKHMPEWFYKDDEKVASKTLLLQRIKAHINTVVGRYKGKVYCWDVINESVSRKKDELFWSDDKLYQIAGEDYVIKAFEYAHEADPNAKLFYNDQFDIPEHSYKVFKFLSRLKKQGVPIDGIGIQCHLGINGISEDQLQNYIDLFSSIGLKVQITELDVSIYKRGLKPSELNQLSDKYSPDIQRQQSQIYKTIFDVCRKNKGKVTGITFWGFADDYGPNSLTKRLNKKNFPFLFDTTFKPKDAFYKITDF